MYARDVKWVDEKRIAVLVDTNGVVRVSNVEFGVLECISPSSSVGKGMGKEDWSEGGFRKGNRSDEGGRSCSGGICGGCGAVHVFGLEGVRWMEDEILGAEKENSLFNPFSFSFQLYSFFTILKHYLNVFLFIYYYYLINI
jgi:hypothetical protein